MRFSESPSENLTTWIRNWRHRAHTCSSRMGTVRSDCQLNVLTFKAASPHFSIAARPWLWMCVSRSFFNSPRPSWILDTRLYMRPKSERRRHHLYVLKQTLCNHSTKCAFIQIPWNKRTFFWTLVIRSI